MERGSCGCALLCTVGPRCAGLDSAVGRSEKKADSRTRRRSAALHKAKSSETHHRGSPSWNRNVVCPLRRPRARCCAAGEQLGAAGELPHSEEPAGIDDAALEAIVSAAASSATAVDRSWLYNDPTRIAAPGRAIGLMRVTYGGGSPTRPFAGNLSTSGAMA